MITKTEKKTFTDRWLKSLKLLPQGRAITWDKTQPGLCIRRSKKIAFYVYKRPKGGKQKWVHLGDYPALTLASAREKARDALNAIETGRSPKAARPGDGGTFEEAAERFMRECLADKRTCKEIQRIFKRELIPVLGAKRLTEISHEDLVTVLKAIAQYRDHPEYARKVGGPHAARKVLARLRVMLRWAAFFRIGGLLVDPSAAIRPDLLLTGIPYTKQRERTLNDAELRAVWNRAEEFGYPFGTLVKALILTGQRLSEISELSSPEICDNEMHIPAERMKNKQEHILPLTEQMQVLIKQLPQWNAGDYLFSTTGGKRPIAGFSKYKARFAEGLDIAPWQLHDIRRTVRTNLSRAQVPVFDAELIIAHQQSGVHGVYDKHRYQQEKLAGLLKWEQLLVHIIDPPTNVSELRKAQ
jgi:integrase